MVPDDKTLDTSTKQVLPPSQLLKLWLKCLCIIHMLIPICLSYCLPLSILIIDSTKMWGEEGERADTQDFQFPPYQQPWVLSNWLKFVTGRKSNQWLQLRVGVLCVLFIISIYHWLRYSILAKIFPFPSKTYLLWVFSCIQTCCKFSLTSNNKDFFQTRDCAYICQLQLTTAQLETFFK